MEYEKIKQLMNDMSKSKLTEINIDFPDGTKISMKKECKEVTNTNERALETEDAKNDINELNDINKEKTESGNIVKSPMVGTFYMKPSPTEKPYVEVGTTVKRGDTLCIIEAMKLMNEIESEFSGKITEVLIKDGETVEYGTPLFRIE